MIIYDFIDATYKCLPNKIGIMWINNYKNQDELLWFIKYYFYMITNVKKTNQQIIPKCVKVIVFFTIYFMYLSVKRPLKRHRHLRNKLLDQGYKKIRLIRSLRKFIFRYQDLVEIYSVSAEKIINDGFSYSENV